MLILCTIKSDHMKFYSGLSYLISTVEDDPIDFGPVESNHVKRQCEVANSTLPLFFFTLGNGISKESDHYICCVYTEVLHIVKFYRRKVVWFNALNNLLSETSCVFDSGYMFFHVLIS